MISFFIYYFNKERKMKIFIISLILILIICYLIYNNNCICKNIESFVTEEVYVTDNQMNVFGSILIDTDKLVDLIDSIKKTNKIDRDIIGVDKNIALAIDPYINNYIFKNNSEVEKYEEGIFVCISTIRLGVEKCLWKLQNKSVAYVSMTDYLFIQAFIKGYRQDVNNIRLIKINPIDLKTKDKLFDYLFTYVVLDSNYMNYIKKQKYFINGLDDVDINRIRAFYPFIEEYYGNIRQIFNKDENDKTYNVYLSNKNSLIPKMRMDIVRNVENFITRLELPADYLEDVDSNYENANNANNSNTGKYGCYGNEKINNKFACDSLYNYDGTPKNYYSKWDKKCSKNEECPYYKSNKKYPNERGGCNNGFCEFPVGVQRIGFTKYVDSGVNSPLCYNCVDTTDYNCCSTIKIPNDNKDYVFENDFNDRKNNKLNTIISLLDYRGS